MDIGQTLSNYVARLLCTVVDGCVILWPCWWSCRAIWRKGFEQTDSANFKLGVKDKKIENRIYVR